MSQLSLEAFLDFVEDSGLLDLPPRRLSKRSQLRRAKQPQTLELRFTWDEETSVDRLRKLRPTCREECRGGPRPCPWVSCRYHLYLEVNEDTGGIKINQPGIEPWELEQSCALDLAETGHPLSVAEIGKIYGVGPERARQLVAEAMLAAREVAEVLGIAVGDEDGGEQ